MITPSECFDFAGLTEDEASAIAEHEHIPALVAAELGAELLQTRAGARTIRAYIEEDIALAVANGDGTHARELREVLSGFCASHPDCR